MFLIEILEKLLHSLKLKKKNRTLLLNYWALTCSGKVLALKLRDHLTGASSATNKLCASLGKSDATFLSCICKIRTL